MLKCSAPARSWRAAPHVPEHQMCDYRFLNGPRPNRKMTHHGFGRSSGACRDTHVHGSQRI